MIPLWLTTTPFLVFDIETTGLDHEADRVVQLATLTIDGGEITDAWSTLVNPSRPIPPEASAIHGITDEMVQGAPSFAEIVPDLLAKSRWRTLLGYNAAQFDAPFLRAALVREGRSVGDRTPVDPLVWIRVIDRWVSGKGRHTLATTCKRWDVEHGGAHNALEDCRATWALWRAMVERGDDVFGPFDRDLIGLLARQNVLAVEQERDFQAWLARQPKEAT